MCLKGDFFNWDHDHVGELWVCLHGPSQRNMVLVHPEPRPEMLLEAMIGSIDGLPNVKPAGFEIDDDVNDSFDV